MSQLSSSLSAASRSILCGIALFAVSMPAALALPIVMQSSTTGLTFEDDGTPGSGIAGSFELGQMIDFSGTGTTRAFANPLNFDSVFEIRNISGSSGNEFAMVDGVVQFAIGSFDTAGVTGFLLADLSFSSITLQGGSGVIGGDLLNISNLNSTNFLYNDYNVLATAGQAAFNISFNYNQSSSLTNLISNGVSISSFTAEITPASVPVAIPIWLFGSALAGIAGIRYRHIRKVKGTI